MSIQGALAASLRPEALAAEELRWRAFGVDVRQAALDLDFVRGRYRLGRQASRNFKSIGAYAGGGGFKIGEKLDASLVGPFPPNEPGETDLGMGVWEARTNLLLSSGALSGAGWSTAGGSVATNVAVAPDGSFTASRITSSGGGGAYSASQSLAANTAYVFSVFLKAEASTKAVLGVEQSVFNGAGGSRAAEFMLDTASWGTVNAALSVDRVYAGNGWWRVTIKFTTGSAPVFGAPITVYGSAGTWFAWGAQLEAGAFPTPYMPTTSAAATRPADAASITGLGSILTPPFTAYVEAYLPANDGVNRSLIQFDDLGSNRFVLMRDSSNGASVYYDPSATYVGVASSKAGARAMKMALRVRAGSAKGAADGVLSPDIAAIPASGLSRLWVGRTSSGTLLNGYVRRVLILPDMDDTALANLTKINTLLGLDFTR